MKNLMAVMAVIVFAPTLAFAQTEGRVSVGVSISHLITTDDEVGSVTTVGPLVRLNPRRGWGPAGGLSWFRADVDNPSGGSGDFARMRIRPVMAGIAYSIGSGNVLTSFSIVGGPSFNKFEFRDQFLDSVAGTGDRPTADIETSVAIRPGVNVIYTVAPRVAISGFGGYVFNRPDVVYRDNFGTEYRDRWKADTFVVSFAAVYSLF